MPKEDLKSLVNSVNMLKNMVESIVAAVQDRFKDYDNVVVTLKDRLDKLESSPGGTASSAGSDIITRISTLEKRLDTLNERLLHIEAVKGVQKEVMQPEVVEVVKDEIIEEPIITDDVDSIITEAPPTPAPVPEIIETLDDMEVPIIRDEIVPVQPTAGIPSIPTPVAIPVPEPEGAIPTPAPTPEPEGAIGIPVPAVEIPTPPTEVSMAAAVPTPAPTPASQITEATERDVSPISKQVSGLIPTPPSAGETVKPTAEIQPPAPRTEDAKPPEEGKSAELFGEAVSGDKAELLKALKKLEDL